MICKGAYAPGQYSNFSASSWTIFKPYQISPISSVWKKRWMKKGLEKYLDFTVGPIMTLL